MKLTYLANIRFPTERAHGAQIAKMCEAFADAGAEVTLVVPHRAVTISEDPYMYYSVRRNFGIIRIGRSQDPQSRIGYWIAYTKFVARIPLYCLRNRADIYYSRDESIVFILSIFGIKSVWEAHGWKDTFFTRHFLKNIEKIIVITNAAKKRFIASGVPERKMLVAPDGAEESLIDADIDKTVARQKLGLPSQGMFVFYIGGLEEWKGFRTLLQCADTLAVQHITIVVVGGIIQELQKEFPNVIFLGFTPYKELAMVQSAADILVIPNSAKSVVSTDYTSPLKLFAHMASMRPIIASDLPSLREILDEETAYFFEPDNSENLTKTIEYVLSHHEEANNKAQAALVKVKEYTWNGRVRKILSFINI